MGASNPERPFERGAIIRSDGEVMCAFVKVCADSVEVRFASDPWVGPVGHATLAQEGTMWARGEWDSVDVVALRALAALRSSV